MIFIVVYWQTRPNQPNNDPNLILPLVLNYFNSWNCVSKDMVKGVNSYEEFLNFLIKGDRNSCSMFTQSYLNYGYSIEDLYENIFKQALYDIGDLWACNKISVASEHLSSAIIEALQNELYTKIISQKKINKTVVLACVENEFHQIGIKMISDVFEINSWNSYFLGANTPINDLVDFAKTKNPNILGLSLSLYFNVPILENMLTVLRNRFPDTPILVGGQAFKYGGQNSLLKFDNVSYLPDLKMVDYYIKNFDTVYKNKNV